MRSKKPTLPSQTQVKKILRDCACDPRKPPYRVIAETGTPEYLIRDAVVALLPDLQAGITPSVVNIRSSITKLSLALALGGFVGVK